METNTALMVYKAYTRSILEYAIFIHCPRNRKSKEALEKVQNRGLRIAMGYRNSTPINVMTAEARVCRVEERARLLARNYWTKTISEGIRKVEANMNRLKILRSRRNYFFDQRGGGSLLVDSWSSFVNDKADLERRKFPSIYRNDY